jgi:hypothetical protein
MGCDLVAVPVADEEFGSASTDTVINRPNETALNNATQDSVTLHATNTPASWLFKTREGGTGILQITGFTENPRGVKIRCKLVQQTGQQNIYSTTNKTIIITSKDGRVVMNDLA